MSGLLGEKITVAGGTGQRIAFAAAGDDHAVCVIVLLLPFDADDLAVFED